MCVVGILAVACASSGGGQKVDEMKDGAPPAGDAAAGGSPASDAPQSPDDAGSPGDAEGGPGDGPAPDGPVHMGDRPPLPPPPGCQATAAKEMACGDGIDDDCDGLIDCEDSDCAQASCGAGLTCTAGACTMPGLRGLPALPRFSVDVRGDTARVSFLPLAGAADHRIYALPAPGAFTQAADGSVTIPGATYRCAGTRPLPADEHTLAGMVNGYKRADAEALLGYVFAGPGAGRTPVFALGDPAPNSDWREGSPFNASRVPRFTTSLAERDDLLGRGFRDDGVAFYVPATGADRQIYGLRTPPRMDLQNHAFVLIYADGPERTARKGQGTEQALFKVLSTQAAGTLPLYRVYYPFTDFHDVLAVGEGMRDRVLHQGNQPVTELEWPGLTGETTLVVEALDRGCPFSGLLAPTDTPKVGYAAPFISLKTARDASPTHEVWINAQFPDTGRPIAVARSFVTVKPQAVEGGDFFADFSKTGVNQQYQTIDSDQNNGNFHLRSELFDVDFMNIEAPSRTIGEVLGQLWVGLADRGADVNGKVRIAPLKMASLATDSYVHVTAAMDLPSTIRRYSQIMISTLPPPIQRSLSQGATVIVQPFAAKTVIQLQLCKNRTWDVNNQCPRVWMGRSTQFAPAYNDNTTPWPPRPVATESSAFDRLVRLDVYASTSRVYIFFDGRPYGCGILPADTWPAGPVSVSLGSVLYHSGVDEEIICPTCGHQYLKRFSLTQTLRKFDDFGFTSGVKLPAWDETLFPCDPGPWK